jgi:hypothetical protein
MNIFLTGEVSSGKSSFLNAISGSIIASSSLQRETIFPEIFSFETNGKYDSKNLLNKLGAIHLENNKIRNNINNYKKNIKEPIKMNIIPMKTSCHMSNNCNIYDFPGLNDSEDSDNTFFNLIQNNISKCDMMIYITKAESAFVNISETQLFDKIKNLVNSELAKGKYIEFIVIVNKFDDPSDEDLNEIYNRIIKKINDDKIKIFRISSHKLLISTIITDKKIQHVPDNIKREFNNILKNADIKITNKLKDSIDKNKLVRYNILEYNDKLDNKKLINYILDGDWDILSPYLLKIMEKFSDPINIQMLYTSEILEKLLNLLNSDFTLGNIENLIYPNLKSSITITEFYNEFDRLIEISKGNKLEINNIYIDTVLNFIDKIWLINLNHNSIYSLVDYFKNISDYFVEKLSKIIICKGIYTTQHPFIIKHLYAEFSKYIKLDTIIIDMINNKDIWKYREIKYYDIIRKTNVETQSMTNILSPDIIFYDLSRFDINKINNKFPENKNIIFTLKFLLASVNDIKLFKFKNINEYNKYCKLCSEFFGDEIVCLIEGLISGIIPLQYSDGIPVYFSKYYDDFVQKYLKFETELLILN